MFRKANINKDGHLLIGGCDSKELAERFGTPLYVYDVAMIKQKVADMRQAFEQHPIKWQIAYASKAFSCIAMVQLVEQLGLSLDVVSGGELFTAIQAGFPPERIHFHGNNKSVDELTYALDSGIGTIIVDNYYELELLLALSEEKNQAIDILFRVTPGITADTHEYITTGQEDSKFGFPLDVAALGSAIKRCQSSQWVTVKGLHCHIGSQIFDTKGYVTAVEKIYMTVEKLKQEVAFNLTVLNAGGGFGIQYTDEDKETPLGDYITAITEAIIRESNKRQWPLPEVWIEPGRALVGDAGTTLYTVGSYKDIPGIRKYLSVDGGMTDNLRPALYQSKYEAMNATKADRKPTEEVSIAGKCCESGDMLIWDVELADTQPGDLLAVFCTGAYGYAMSNNYNRITRPAVVFAEEGEAQLVVKRESYEDLIKQDIAYNPVSLIVDSKP